MDSSTVCDPALTDATGTTALETLAKDSMRQVLTKKADDDLAAVCGGFFMATRLAFVEQDRRGEPVDKIVELTKPVKVIVEDTPTWILYSWDESGCWLRPTWQVHVCDSDPNIPGKAFAFTIRGPAYSMDGATEPAWGTPY